MASIGWTNRRVRLFFVKFMISRKLKHLYVIKTLYIILMNDHSMLLWSRVRAFKCSHPTPIPSLLLSRANIMPNNAWELGRGTLCITPTDQMNIIYDIACTSLNPPKSQTRVLHILCFTALFWYIGFDFYSFYPCHTSNRFVR